MTAGFIKGPITGYMWMPMLVFEVALALWLIVKGVAAPSGLGYTRWDGGTA